MRAIIIALAACAGACSPSHPASSTPARVTDGRPRLPTGVRLDPAGRSIPVGNMPLAALASPDNRWLVLSMSGYREQGIEVIDRSSGTVVERLEQPGAFLGLAWSKGGDTLYVSGGVADVVYAYHWRSTSSRPATLADSIPLYIAPEDSATRGARYPAGIALAPDGRTLYVAENLSDSLAVVDLTTRRVIQRVSVGPFPYGVAVAPDGHVYASAWGADYVAVFHAAGSGRLIADRVIDAGRHPSALLLTADGGRLFIASASTDRVGIVDPKVRRVLSWLTDPPPDGVTEGSTPNALALAPDGTRLFVAEGDANAVAVFDLATGTLAGRIPTEWYPSAIVASGDSLWIVNGKGRGTRPNPRDPLPTEAWKLDDTSYTLGQLNGTVIVAPAVRGPALDALSARVARANGWDMPHDTRAHYPPITHVVYIIKENRTYDQILGDLAQADGDTTLLFFPRAISPNHHALAERFGIFDRFFTNSEVSEQGHPWATSAYVTDYSEKTTPSSYRNTRPEPPELGETDEPAGGYLWDAARKTGVSFRDYGEYMETARRDSTAPPVYRAVKPGLAPFTSPIYPPFDLTVADQVRADAWLTELHAFERAGQMPALEMLHLPNDHTAGPAADMHTPRAFMADNDLALGRIIEGLSRSPFWKSTVVFVLEDDPQDGPDHVDSHRSVMLAISPWTRGGVLHRFVNTTDVIATIEEILGLPSLSQFDRFGRPLRDIWADHPDLRPYVALTPSHSLTELNVAQGPDVHLDFSRPDRVDDALFNHLLWRQIKGAGVPYPSLHQAPVQELVRSR